MTGKCNLPLPPVPLQVPKMCGGELVSEGEGPERVTTCLKCKSRWTEDGKE